MRAERRIAVIKLGKHIRIDSNDLDAYITASRQEFVANAMGGQLFRAVGDTLAVRAGHSVVSTPGIAIGRALGDKGSGRYDRLTAEDRSHS